MKLTLVFIFIFFSFATYAAKKEYGTVIVDEVTSIYDADTFRVNI